AARDAPALFAPPSALALYIGPLLRWAVLYPVSAKRWLDLERFPALKALTEEFGRRTGIAVEFETVVFRNRLDQDAKIALYRIAQEALTNVERHANAAHLAIKVWGHAGGASLRIADDGAGMDSARRRDPLSPGLGLRNMQERIEGVDGTLSIHSSREGTVIEAQVPLSRMLPPEDDSSLRTADRAVA
ncbi:MAG: ATP-binding protein, partial [Pseudomonadota bacterium]